VAPQARNLAHQKAIGARFRAPAFIEAKRKSALILALAGFEAALRLVDDVDAAFAADDAVIPMAGAQRAQGIADFHRRNPWVRPGF
jgi:hypothetical protein